MVTVAAITYLHPDPDQVPPWNSPADRSQTHPDLTQNH